MKVIENKDDLKRWYDGLNEEQRRLFAGVVEAVLKENTK